MTPEQTFVAIRLVITKLIEAGLADEQRYPSIKSVGGGRCEIGIEGAPDLSATLKDVPYDEAFLELEKARAFNVKMIDGALIQLAYTFVDNVIHSHRLAFFPAPSLEAYEDAASAYEDDEIFADIVGRYLVRFPIRFDYSSSDEEWRDVDHPKSHLTLGQYKNCRIPATGPMTPVRFIQFVVRNFYFSTNAHAAFKSDDVRPRFDATISPAESGIPHLVI